MALLANQLLDPRVLSGMNGRMDLAPFLQAQHHASTVAQATATDEDARKNRKYPCPLCGKRFRFNSILSLHMRTHTGEKPFKCPYCEHRAAQKGNLKIHLRTHKGILGKGRGRIREENRLLHELEERAILRDRQTRGGGLSQPPHLPQPQPLPQAELLTPSGPADALPLLSPSPKTTTPLPDEPPPQTTPPASSGFRCSFCKGKFRKQQELERHIRILHKPYKCTLCDYAASREEQLINHVETAHISSESVQGGRPAAGGGGGGRAGRPGGEFPCEVCGQTFSQAWFLKGHMRKHKDSFEHCCQICGRRFKEPWFLKNHMKVHVNKLAAKSSAKAPGVPDADVAGGLGVGAVALDPQANLYSRYISSLHSRLLSSERAGQPDYRHVLSVVGVELKVKEMLGRMLAQEQGLAKGESSRMLAQGQAHVERENLRMLAQGQDSLLGLGRLLPPLSSGSMDYLQAATSDRDALSNSASTGYPGWQILPPGLALEQVYAPNDQRHHYRSERRVCVDERRVCDSERRVCVSDPETNPTENPGTTGLSHSLPQSQTGTNSSHTGNPQQDRPQSTSPAPGAQAYRCPLPSDFPSTPSASLGCPLERYRPPWPEHRDPPTPQTPRTQTPKPRDRSPRPRISPGLRRRPADRSPSAADDDSGRIRPDALLLLGDGRSEVGDGDAGGGEDSASVAVPGRGSQQEPLDLSLRPDWGAAHLDGSPEEAGSQPQNQQPGLCRSKPPSSASKPHHAPGASSDITTPPSNPPPPDPGSDAETPAELEGHRGGSSGHNGDAASETAADREDGDAYRWKVSGGDLDQRQPGASEAPRGAPREEQGQRWGRGAARPRLSSPGELEPEQNQHHRNLLAVLRSSRSHGHAAAAAALKGGGVEGADRTDRKPFQCRFCPYSSSQKGNLKTHVLCVHRQPFDSSLYPDRRLRRGPHAHRHHTPPGGAAYPPPGTLGEDAPAPGRDIAMTSLCGT